MAMGKSVHIKGLGYFRYTLDSTGVEKLEDFDFEKQVKAVRVEFTPERERLSGSKAYTRALVDSDDLEWIELSPDTKDDDPAQGGGTQEDKSAWVISLHKKNEYPSRKPGGRIRKADRVGIGRHRHR